MKSMLFFLLACLALPTVPAWANNPLERNRSLRRELADLQSRKNALLEESSRLKETKLTLETTRDLLSGKLEKPPVDQPDGNILYRFETKQPNVIDNTKSGKRSVVHRWLKLEPGKTYLFEGMIRLEHSEKSQKRQVRRICPCLGRKDPMARLRSRSGKIRLEKVFLHIPSSPTAQHSA